MEVVSSTDLRSARAPAPSGTARRCDVAWAGSTTHSRLPIDASFAVAVREGLSLCSKADSACARMKAVKLQRVYGGCFGAKKLRKTWRGCDKPRGAAKRALIRGSLNGETCFAEGGALHAESIGVEYQRGELKHLSNRRNRKKPRLPQ